MNDVMISFWFSLLTTFEQRITKFSGCTDRKKDVVLMYFHFLKEKSGLV
jgi:hypothetical protein